VKALKEHEKAGEAEQKDNSDVTTHWA
jgi:hypothetical protein